jgi:hypothetical protein
VGKASLAILSAFLKYQIRQFAPRAPMPFLATMQIAIGRLLENRDSDPRLWWGRKHQGGPHIRELHDEAYLVPKGQRREAIAIVLQYWCQFLQVKNLQILRIDGRQGVDMKWIAKQTGLSHTRVKRAVRDLLACGWIGRYQPRDRIGTAFQGKAAIRWVTYKLLNGLKLWRAFQALRKAVKLPPAKEPSSAKASAMPTVADLASMMKFQT